MADAVLTLNCGSSSIKFALFERSDGVRRIAYGKIEELGSSPKLFGYDASGATVVQRVLKPGTHESFLDSLLCWTDENLDGHRMSAVGHRIVHGADQFGAPCLLTEAAREALTKLEPLAPLHQPHNLSAVRAVSRLRPDLPQIGCFDTAFHQTMSATARRFGLPLALEHAGLRRYGFHGLSYEFIAGRLRDLAPGAAGGRILVAHLGNGASLCALKDGRSVDTSMGFSALDGLVMGTRCGALDPGVMLYLMRHGADAASLEHLLYFDSGLLGVSGISADMRVLLASDSPGAREAIELFVFRAAREAAALISSMGDIDGIVFTAGMGENSPEIRSQICDRLGWLGLRLDRGANQENCLEIQAPSSGIRAWVIPTDEELVIAQHTFSLLLDGDQ